MFACFLIKNSSIFLHREALKRISLLSVATNHHKWPTRDGNHIHMCIFDSSMIIMWKGWNTKEGIYYHQGACSSPLFLISRTFSELSRWFRLCASVQFLTLPIKPNLQFIVSFLMSQHTLLSNSAAPMSGFSPPKRSSVWIAVSVSVLIDLFVQDWLGDWLRWTIVMWHSYRLQYISKEKMRKKQASQNIVEYRIQCSP